MRKTFKRVVSFFLVPLAKWFLSRSRTYHYKNLRLKVFPGVFHPGLFFSTSILLNYLERHDLSNKKFLELGAGSGLISLIAATKGATVTASDISETALENITWNASKNNLQINVVKSDLFAALKPANFDFIIINPPYYPSDPKTEAEHAWYCGTGHEYFKRLFQQLSESGKLHSIFMILSEDCDIKKIQDIALSSGMEMQLVHVQRKWFEMNYIFSVTPTFLS